MDFYVQYKEKQIHGVTIGFPLGPTNANIFLGHLEEKSFDHKSICFPKLYLKYTDDVFAVVLKLGSMNQYQGFSGD